MEDWDTEDPIDFLDKPTVGIQFIGKHIDPYIPQYATPGSSGVDLRADISEQIIVKSGMVWKIGTGIRLHLPEGYEAQIRSRSGLAAKHGARVVNSPGTIDSDYYGEIVILMETIDTFIVKPGDRIAQMVFMKVPQVLFEIEEIDTEASERGVGGFGSTGTN